MAETRTLEARWRDVLPESLAERVRCAGSSATPARATHVLYWMRSAPRGHDHPALDAAILAAESLGVPAYVFHGLSPHPALASPRRLDFALDAACDAARELATRGIPYALHVVKRGERARPLAALARGAALLVTELAPLEPDRTWVRAFAEKETPLWCVDAASLVPSAEDSRAPLAFHRYRDGVRDEVLTRLLRPWKSASPLGAYATPRWPFEPVDPAPATRAALHLACELAHGETAAFAGGASSGYALWNEWKKEGLRAWPSERADPAATSGAQIGALLDAGHLSPFRLGREAGLQGNAGAKRWLRDHLSRADHAAALGARLEPAPSAIDLQDVRLPPTLLDRGVLTRAARWAWLRSLTRQVTPEAAAALVVAASARFAANGPSLRELAEIRSWCSRRTPVEIRSGLDEGSPGP